MNLGQHHQQVRDALGRGNALDAQIVSHTKEAVRWLERNAEPGYKYMELLRSTVLNKNATFPHVVDFPQTFVKTTLFCRLILASGEYSYLRKIAPQDVPSLVVDVPSGYYINGTQGIVLDCKPDENYTLELMTVSYTDWPTADDSTHWLLDNASDVLRVQTLYLMAPWVRDARLLATYRTTRDEGLKTLVGSIIDLDNYDQDNSMQYNANSLV